MTQLDRARKNLADLRDRQRKLADDLAAAKTELDRADGEAVAAMAAVHLGEATDAVKATAARQKADDAARSLAAAGRVIAERIAAAELEVKTIERAELSHAATLAGQLAATELDRVHSLAHQLGSAIKSWCQLETASRCNQGFRLGEHARERLQVESILEQYRVFAELEPRFNDHSDYLSPADVRGRTK
jgi:hypothetical protein